MASSFEIARLRREELGEALQGSVKRTPLSEEELATRTAPQRSGELVAVWRKQSGQLPVLLSGRPDDLSDACAWAGAYLSGLGPLSSIMRLLSTDALAASLAPTVEQPSRSQLATQFVGVIFGELFARLQPSIRASRPTLAGATSTLAYAIARACLGLVPFGVEETISRWHFARSVVGSAQSPRIDDSVIAVCREIVGSALWRSPKGSSQLSFLTGDKSPAAPPIETLLASEGQPEFAKIDTLPAEERVRVADRVLASILASGVPPPVQAQAAAIVVRRAVHGYFAQRRLIEPFLNRLPEASVWLGAAQKDTAPPELFGTEDGLGWRILGRTEENVDIFSRPQCDVSVDELRTYVNRSRADLPGSTTRSIVEVAPGVNLAILKAATEIPSKRSSKRVDPRKDALDAAADSLKQAMAALAELRKRERR